MKTKLLFTFFLIGFITASGQIVLTPGSSASAMLSSFIGSGLTITNATINCPANAYGTFSNGNTTSIGINNGIILTTGSISAAAGPDSGPSVTACNSTSSSDPDLLSLDPQAGYDPCILEFDFIPQCNQLTMTFVFGSEEYPEYVGSSFNDVFGFFISGPNPSGGNYTNYDIARLPNSTICSINTINGSSNSSYYIDNQGGSTIQYDGITTQITSGLSLTPCATYHFKIAIADAGDCSYDSGVFIDLFQCANSITLSPASTASGCVSNNGTATVTVSNGFPPYTYTWSPAPGGGQGTNSVTGLTGGTTYTVTVNDSYTCSVPVTSLITIGGTPAPTPIITTNGATTLCSGGNVTLDAGAGYNSYSWSNGATTQTINVPSSGSYSVTVTDGNGCSGTTATATIVTVNSNPTPTITSSGATTLCSGGSVTLDAGAGYNTYLWNNGASTQSIIITSSGNYSVTVTDINGCSGSSIASTIVTVNPNPTPSITYGATTFCSGGNLSLNAGAGFSSYSWSNGATTQTTTITSSGNYIYSVNVTDVNGCTGSDTASISVTVNTNPTPTINTTGATVFCSGGTVTLDAGAGYSSYSWSNGTTTQTNTVTSSGSYSVTVTDANGCTGSSNTSTLVTVNPNPTPTISASAATTFCSGGNVTLNAGTGYNSYSWSNGQTIQTINVTTSGSYSVTVTDANGCSGSASIPVTVNPLPVADTSSIVISKANCGENTGAVNGITLTSGQSPYTYVWHNAFGAIVGNGGSDITNMGAGVYSVTITDANGCSTIAGPFAIDSTAGVTAAFTSDTASGETPLTINFTNGSIGATNYLWQFGTGDTSSTINPTYVYVPLGDFTVCLIANNSIGCYDTVCSVIDVYINSVFIIPNIFTPNHDNVNDLFKNAGKGLKTLDAEIYDRWGLKMYEWHTVDGGWDGYTASGVPAAEGTYYYIIKAEGIDEKKYSGKGPFSLVRGN